MSFKAQRGNKYLELLSTSNKLLIDQWKIHSSVQKEYDALSKTYIYNVGGKSPMAQMCLPKDKKQKLDLYYPLLVLQLCFPVKSNILCDIGISSYNSQRKRITLSSNQKSPQNSSLFTVLPFIIENFNSWVHVLVDVEEIVSGMWNGLQFKGLDFLSLSGVFRLKRIFLLSRDMTDFTEGTYVIRYDQLPKQMLLPRNISQIFKYVSSCQSSSKPCMKEANLAENSRYDESNVASNKNSSRCSLGSGRFNSSKMKTIPLSEEIAIPAVNFLGEPSISSNHMKEVFENEFNLNFSALTFSEMPKFGNHNEIKFGNMDLKINQKPSPKISSDDSDEHNLEIWMPMYYSDKTSI